MKSEQCRFGVEQLESRDCPAGFVTSAVNNGLLTITGDGEANQVQVIRSGQQVSITGLTGTQVRGPTTADGIVWVAIRLGVGDDVLRFSNSGVQPLAALSVNGGDGYDDISLYGVQVAGDVGISLGRGDDQFYMQGTANRIAVDGGTGNNTMTLSLGAGTVRELTVVSAERASSGRDDLTIRGSGDATRIDVLTVRTGSQDDSFRMSSFATSRVSAHAGGGADHVFWSGIRQYGERRFELEGFERLN